MLSFPEMSIVNPVLSATLALFETQRLVHLSTVDLVIIVFYFLLVQACCPANT